MNSQKLKIAAVVITGFMLVIFSGVNAYLTNHVESEALKRDAKRWWQQKPKNVDYTSFWNSMCQKPTENMRAYFSGNKIPNKANHKRTSELVQDSQQVTRPCRRHYV